MFKIILTDGQQDHELHFKVRDTLIAHKWFLELQKNYNIYEDDRFTKWGNKNLIEKLNEYIDVINNYDNIVNRKIDSTVSQDDLNYLHKFFEDLRGEVEERTIWFDNAPTSIKKTVEKFNVLIHELETELRPNDHPTLVVTFKNRPRYNLTEEDMEYFTYKWDQACVYINYCHVGKPLLDIFKDNDPYAEGIRPQTHYSADFMIKFGPQTPEDLYLKRKEYLDKWLHEKQYNFKYPNLGMILVADLIGNLDLDNLFRYNKVKEIVCNP